MLGTTTAVVIAQNLRLRAAPSLAATISALLAQATRVELIELAASGWVQVRVQAVPDPLVGWCMRRMLDLALQQPMPDLPVVQDQLWDLATGYANRVGYLMGAKAASLHLAAPVIDCSGWVAFLLQSALAAENTSAQEVVFHPDDIDVLNAWSDRIILEVEARTPLLLTGFQISPQTLRGGMAIGLRGPYGAWETDAPRARGINHIAAVVRRPSDQALFISESRGPSGSGGVKLTDAAAWLAGQTALLTAGRAWAVDAIALADPFSDTIIAARATLAPG